MRIKQTRIMTLIILLTSIFISLSVIFTKGVFAESQENPVLAEVGEEKITLNDLKDAAKGASTRGYIDLSIEEKKKLLDNMIGYKLLYIEAKNRKLDTDPEVIKALEDAKRDIMSRYLTQLEVLPKVKVSEDEIKEHYEKNKGSYMPQMADITRLHILTQNAAGDLKPEEAKKTAHLIKERLSKGESFENIFSSYKEDKEWGGSVSEPSNITIQKGKYYTSTNFDEVIFNLTKGGFGIVEFPDRFLIVRLNDILTPEPPPLEKVSAAISGNLKQKKWDTYFKEFIESLKKNIPVKQNEELIK